MTRSTVFTSNRSQAVRLPKAVAFPEGVNQVEIIKIGHSRLISAGQPAGPHDMTIGGHARSEGLILVTNNLREFERMNGLRAESWV